MEYTYLIQNRESVRNYDPQKPVSKEVLERILNAGHLAQSACNYQPWEFWVIQSPGMLDQLRECYYRPWFKDAPCLLVVVGFKDKAWVRSYDKYNSLETDLAIAMTHLILAAENEGVGTCYIEAYDPAILRKVLNLNDNQIVYGITPLGYQRQGYTKKGNKSRKSLQEVVRYL